MVTRSIVVSGFMGTGKTVVGERLAAHLALPWIDTDAHLSAETGQTVEQLWNANGEAGFRRLESALIERLLDEPTPRILAFGGGTVTQKHLRRRALQHSWVVTLTASPETILQRVKSAIGRPNLHASDLHARVIELLAERREAYAECHVGIATDSLSVDEIVDQIVSQVARDPIVVPLGARTYRVDVVDDAPSVVTQIVESFAPSSIVWVTDVNVHRERGASLRLALDPIRIPKVEVVVPAGEPHKLLSTVSAIWDAALEAGIDRNALFLAAGGGVVGDMAGFAASTLLRGMRWVQVPTTLLAMVDASVGGKTGFDHSTGKNLIGTFHQPSAVVVDLAHLATLPDRERTAGWAEVVKVALVADSALVDFLEQSASALAANSLSRDHLARAIRASVTAKVALVTQDEHEHGVRALLNAGHTVGHALETYAQYQGILHGEAVSLGLLAELRATTRLGLTESGVESRVHALLDAMGLPVELDHTRLVAAWDFVNADKKRQGVSIRLPVVKRVGIAEVVHVSIDELREAVLG